jgi:hypothetical protein
VDLAAQRRPKSNFKACQIPVRPFENVNIMLMSDALLYVAALAVLENASIALLCTLIVYPMAETYLPSQATKTGGALVSITICYQIV